MTSKAKIEANRRNALKSTGPRSKFGKSRSSRNALKHGLTAKTDPQETSEIFQEILAKPGLDFMENCADETTTRAMRLAAAEARLRSALQNEHELLQEYRRFFDHQIYDEGLIESLMEGALFETKFNKREAREILQIAGMGIKGGAYAASREFELARRYLREAEAAHAKALKAWCQIDRPISRNEAK